LWALGKNDIGQLGLGRESTYEPVPVSTNMRNIKSILRLYGYETDCYLLKEAKADRVSHWDGARNNLITFILYDYHFRGLRTDFNNITDRMPNINLILYPISYSSATHRLIVKFDPNIDFLAGPLRDLGSTTAEFILQETAPIRNIDPSSFEYGRKYENGEESYGDYIITYFIKSGRIYYQKDDFSLWVISMNWDYDLQDYVDNAVKVGDLNSKISSTHGIPIYSDDEKLSIKTENNYLYLIQNDTIQEIDSEVDEVFEYYTWQEYLTIYRKDGNFYLADNNVSDEERIFESNETSAFGDNPQEFDFTNGETSKWTVGDDDFTSLFGNLDRNNLINEIRAKGDDLNDYPSDHLDFDSILDRNIPDFEKELMLIELLRNGDAHAVFRKQDGSVWGYGSNRFNQLGDTGRLYHFEPVQIFPVVANPSSTTDTPSSNSGSGSGSTDSIESLSQEIANIKSQLLNLVSKSDFDSVVENLATVEDLSTAVEDGKISGILDVIENPTAYSLTHLEVLESSGATPHTNGWYYKQNWGWLWTSAKIFPYVFRVNKDDDTSDWLYFKENSSPPYYYNYSTDKWVIMEE